MIIIIVRMIAWKYFYHHHHLLRMSGEDWFNIFSIPYNTISIVISDLYNDNMKIMLHGKQ